MTKYGTQTSLAVTAMLQKNQVHNHVHNLAHKKLQQAKNQQCVLVEMSTPQKRPMSR
jgi:hypothetical protein